MENKISDVIGQAASKNRIGHAYLIHNTTLSNIDVELVNVINSYFINIKSLNNNNDIIVVDEGDGVIKKNCILELTEKLVSSSQINGKKIYIINNVEMLNAHAANSLLKTLEEPEDNIYAFLISNSINNVLPTIKSRCMLISLENGIEYFGKYDDEVISNFISFISKYHNGNVVSTFDIKSLFDCKNKNMIKGFIDLLIRFYRDVINIKNEIEVEYFKDDLDLINDISNKVTESSLTNAIIVLDECMDRLSYNLNLDMFLDKLFIKLARCFE